MSCRHRAYTKGETVTDWFARPVLHVTDVEASLRFYVNRLGFTSPWQLRRKRQSACRTGRSAGLRAYPGRHVAGEDWQRAVVHFPECRAGEAQAELPRWTRCARNSRPRAFRSRRVRGATGFWSSMIPTAISSSSTIRPRMHPARLQGTNHNRPAARRRDVGGPRRA